MEMPTTKAALLRGIREERQRLEYAFKRISPSDMAKASHPDAWSVKDNLAHIAAWEKKLLKWYETGLRGEKQAMPQWSQPGLVDEINLEIYQRNRGRQLDDVLQEFKESYQQILATVESMPEDGMFTSGKYDWTGQGTLADYIVGNTSGHYAEHLKMIEALKKKP
jgi:hypothetical protein